MSDHAETSRLEVLRQYQAAREQFRLCIAAILDPIEVRLNEFPENAFTELYTDNVALDEALAKSKEADGILTRLKRLVTQAAYHRIEVEPVETLDGQCEQINLKLELAWALNQRELRSAIEKAQSWMKSHPVDGIFQVLLEQANTRLKKVASAAALVNSTEQRAEALQELMASLNEMDSAPIGDLLEIKKSFDDILEMNQSLQRYQVTEILDERDIDDQGKAKYRTLPELSKQREDIRETVRTVIKVFSDKVDRFIVHDPKVAADWFMPIKLFQEYLHPEQDAGQLAENEVMCSTIEQNCGKWDQAEALLTQVDSLLDPARLPTTSQDKTLWDVCDLVRSAEENYSYHIGIDKRAATCILKIEEVMAREMSRWQEGCEVNLAKEESGLVCEPDWDGEWLQTANLPAWLTSDQKVLAVWQQQIDGFQQNLELHLGLAAQRQLELIEEAVGRLMECFQKQQTWQNILVEKRLSIRAFIIQVQELIQQGSQDHQQGLYQEAQNLYLDYVSQHAEWRADVELEKVKQLLEDFLSDSQKLKNACLAYLAGQWSECITDCHSYSKSLPILPLGAHIRPANWLSQLQNGQDETIPATEIDEVARILLQLANVMLAAQEIERCYSEALYAAMGPHLDNIELFGQGESPLVAERKTQIQFDTCKQEYHARLAFGDNHYLPEGSINQQANVILVESKKLLAAPASEAAWLADVQRTLSNLVSLDPEQASLWVGDIRNWQVALSNQFVRELDPYLSKMAATISQQITQDVEQAFGFCRQHAGMIYTKGYAWLIAEQLSSRII